MISSVTSFPSTCGFPALCCQISVKPYSQRKSQTKVCFPANNNSCHGSTLGGPLYRSRSLLWKEQGGRFAPYVQPFVHKCTWEWVSSALEWTSSLSNMQIKSAARLPMVLLTHSLVKRKFLLSESLSQEKWTTFRAEKGEEKFNTSTNTNTLTSIPVPEQYFFSISNLSNLF